jgi:hypothetical protein
MSGFNLSPYQGKVGMDSAMESAATGGGGGNMPFAAIAPLIGAGLNLIGGIFGSMSQAKKERDARKREEQRKPWMMNQATQNTMYNGYNPGTGANVFSLFPLMNQRMMSIMGSRYSNPVYKPGSIPVQGANPGVSGMNANAMYQNLARKEMS